jgi:cytochrome c553
MSRRCAAPSGAIPEKMMRSTHVLAATATLVAVMTAGCANPERSRDLNNPAVPAVTLAQQVCSNCHGVTGVAVSPNFPNLAGQPEAYLVAQLNGFKGRGRRDPAGFEYMWGLSRHLTDAQIQGLAAYYAAQTPARQPSEGTAAQIDAGRTIFTHGVPAKNIPPCLSCHGDAGQGNATFPRLAGQHADYVIKQLVVFQRTDERPEGSIMKTIAHDLTGNDIRNVAAFVQAWPAH